MGSSQAGTGRSAWQAAGPAKTGRDGALFAAVAGDRSALTTDPLPSLLIDGREACDQLAAYQLAANGFIRPAGRCRRLLEVELTEDGTVACIVPPDSR